MIFENLIGSSSWISVREIISSPNLSVLSGIFVSEIPSGVSDEGAFQRIFEPACLFFPGNNACNNTRKGKEKKHYFAEGVELCYKNILPEYFHVSGRGIKRKFDFSADFF